MHPISSTSTLLTRLWSIMGNVLALMKCAYRVILMDMQMPQLDGLEATRLIRAIPGASTVTIIAMTANAFAEDRALCLEAGMDDFIAKPFEPDDLFAVLYRHLSRRVA